MTRHLLHTTAQPSSDVTALYVMPDGPYPELVFDWWDEERNAKHYNGNNPVVAHPPCGPWSKLRHMCTRQDPDCGPRAVEQVREFGGVLEHPEHSKLWEHCDLPKPGKGSDGYGRTFLVRQVAWGHPCVKPTWIYCVGINVNLVESGIRTGGEPTHCVCTGPGQLKRLPVAHKKLKMRTPRAFAEFLVSLAASVHV
jgi:hypothetical protein